MEPEGSLPCSQELSVGPYPEPDESSPYHPILLHSGGGVESKLGPLGTSAIYWPIVPDPILLL
jgi:hypothetical protein